MESESDLPKSSKFSAFISPRIRDIKALDGDLDICAHGKRAFQKLPRNMQRRNVSHNSQRLPHSLRKRHKEEVGTTKKNNNKRPCRKYRRRPANLLIEYNRRQRSQVWLETHIWHAKRFHMTHKWNYVLPNTPTFKSTKALLRAASETCKIQDVSYECCIELEGDPSAVQKKLSMLMPPNEVTKSFDADAIKAAKWIQTTLYHQNKFPFGVIGDCQIMFSPQSSKESYKLWLWVHPSVFEEVLNALIEVFNLKFVESEVVTDSNFKPADHVTEAKLALKNIPIEKAPQYTSEIMKLTVLKDTLAKFRLIGPGSYSLLRKVLIPSQVTSNSDKDSEDKKKETPWWVSSFSNHDHLQRYNDQVSLWKSLEENYAHSKKMISLVVRDVRVILPSQKVPWDLQEFKTSDIERVYCSAPLHPIFESDIRESVTRDMKSTDEINTMRGKLLVPGSILPLTNEESRVPVLLLQRPGAHISNLGHGWDIILPCGWATQTFICCVLNGAAVGGQKEEETLMNEFLTPPNPHHLPDSNAGRLYAQQEKQERYDEFFRKPPNCRPNYIVLGVKFPFGINWLELMKSFNNSCEDFYVLRDKEYLKFLSFISCKKFMKLVEERSSCTLKREASEDEGRVVKKLKTEDKSVPVKLSDKEIEIQKVFEDHKNSLLYVRLIVIGKGRIDPFATVCLPTEEELKTVTMNSGIVVNEPPHEDQNSKKRTDLKEEHQRNLNHMRRKRKKARNDVICGKENPLDNHSTMQEALDAAVGVVNKENMAMVKTIESYNSDFNNLWFQSPEETFQNNSRKIIGFMTGGGHCKKLGRSGGLGYVVTTALIEHLKKLDMFDQHKKNKQKYNQIYVLTRNPLSSNYLWARLIIVDIHN